MIEVSNHAALSKRAITCVIVVLALASSLVGGVAASAYATTAPLVNVRVEGSATTLFSGNAVAGSSAIVDTDAVEHDMSGNAMAALDAAARLGAFPYEIKNSAYGLYVSQVGYDAPDPNPPYPGWMFRVNGAMPSFGADQVALNPGDSVLWYFGTYDASPTVAMVPSSPVVLGSTATVTAEQLDAAGMASPLPFARVTIGSRVATADADGHVALPMNQLGKFGVRVDSAGCIRSALASVDVRYGSGFSGFSASRSSVRRRKTVTFGGSLRSNGSPLSSRRVTLMGRKIGSSKWITLATARTNSSGRFGFIGRPVASMNYRAVWSGDASHVSAASATRLVSVR